MGHYHITTSANLEGGLRWLSQLRGLKWAKWARSVGSLIISSVESEAIIVMVKLPYSEQGFILYVVNFVNLCIRLWRSVSLLFCFFKKKHGNSSQLMLRKRLHRHGRRIILWETIMTNWLCSGINLSKTAWRNINTFHPIITIEEYSNKTTNATKDNHR